jgi:hypothetical protein
VLFFERQDPTVQQENSDTNKEASQKERPFSRRTFRKEVNTLARKAVKKGALGIYTSALKRQQDNESKAKMAKRRAIENKDSLSSEDSMSVHNIEKQVLRSLAKPIPCTIVKRTLVAKVSLAKDTKKKASKSIEKEDALSEAVNNMQLDEDKIEMIESDDDEIFCPSTAMKWTSEVYPWNKIVGLMLVSLMAIDQNKKLLNVLLPRLNYSVPKRGLKLRNSQL